MAKIGHWAYVLGILALVIGVPITYHRWTYTYGKRLREVVPGKFYRSGQMTADGFRDAVKRLGIRTVINVQDDYPDPDIRTSFFNGQTVKESALCKELGVKYVALAPDVVPKRDFGLRRPAVIDKYLALLDKPDTYPVLLHCKAGLHRTGILTAIYRMEYQKWTPQQAMRELQANGFGLFVSSRSNDYITQYVLEYHPGERHAGEEMSESK